MKEHFWLKVIISICALGVILARMVWPNLKLDVITFGLIVVAILPWLSTIIESAKFPGGWEVKFRTIQLAGRKVIESSTGEVQASEPSRPAYLEMARSDPNLALAGLRIEIEKRLRLLAEKHRMNVDGSLIRLFHALRERGVLSEDSIDGLQDLIMAGNSAVHGAKVEEAVADWAFEYGPQVLAVLDSKLEN
jgi:hypothetical protein